MEARDIAHVPLFEGLGPDELERIADRMREVRIPAGGSVIEQGDLSYKFFVILDGVVEVERDGIAVNELGPGDFVGETGILGHDRRNADVVARSDVRVAAMIGWDVRDMIEEYPRLAGRLRWSSERRSLAPKD